MTQIVESAKPLPGSLMQIPENFGTESVSTKDVAPTFLSIDPKTGEIKKSTSGEVLGGTGKDFEVICVKHMKEHQYVDNNGKTHYRHPYDENLKSNETVMMNGVPCERIGSHVFFFLVAGREADGVVVYSARKTSRWAAEKTILPVILAWQRLNQSIAEATFKFKSEQKINDAKQKYFVCHFEKGSPVSKEQRELAKRAWWELSRDEEKAKKILSQEEVIIEEKTPFWSKSKDGY